LLRISFKFCSIIWNSGFIKEYVFALDSYIDVIACFNLLLQESSIVLTQVLHFQLQFSTLSMFESTH